MCSITPRKESVVQRLPSGETAQSTLCGGRADARVAPDGETRAGASRARVVRVGLGPDLRRQVFDPRVDHEPGDGGAGTDGADLVDDEVGDGRCRPGPGRR